MKFRILLIIILLFAPVVFAVPVVSVLANPENPSAGDVWTLTLTINYPRPEDVIVSAPQFADFLSLDRIIKHPSSYAESHVFTIIEYRFIPIKSGRFTLESFKIETPAGVTETTPIILDIRSESNTFNDEQRQLTPQIIWETPQQLTAGERATLLLRVISHSSRLPPQEFFAPEVPPGVILVLAPLPAEERTNGILLKLTLIPLQKGDFRLPARVLQYENTRFEIPALHITIR